MSSDKRGELMNLRSLGTTGLKRQGTYVFDEWHPQLWGTRAIRAYREMADNDAVVGSILYSMESFISQASITIEPADKSPQAAFIATHVESCLHDMSMTLQEFISDIMSMAWAGYSYHEIVYKMRRGTDAPLPMLRSKYGDGLIGWRKIPIRAQDSIDGWQFDDDGGICGAYQMAEPLYRRVFLPIDKALLFRTRSNKNNPEGRSILRNAWRSWLFLKRIQEYEAIGIQKDMTGVLKYEMPPQYLDADADAGQKARVAEARLMMERAQRGESEGFVIPSEADSVGTTGFRLSQIQSGGRKPIDTDPTIRRYESRIALSVLGEAVLLGMQGNVGSWSLADSKTHMFAIALKGMMDGIADVINRFAIPRLVELNGWPVPLSPRWQFGDIESEDLNTKVATMAQAVGNGLITPGRELELHVREMLSLPIDETPSLGQMQDAVGQYNETQDAAGQTEQDTQAQTTGGWTDENTLQDVALNGAQVSSLLDIIAQVA